MSALPLNLEKEFLMINKGLVSAKVVSTIGKGGFLLFLLFFHSLYVFLGSMTFGSRAGCH